MVFHLVTALYFYAQACIAITETVRVAEDGCEIMTKFPAELICV
jgi:Xaa-Pro aminopeptidase